MTDKVSPVYTVGIKPTDAPFTDEKIKNNEVPELVEEGGVKQWDSKLPDDISYIPYKVVEEIGTSENPM